jgi:multisubunit Na+/H+ antiporter MnhB subunit
MSDFRHSILPAAARLVVPVQYAFAIYLLLRGHNLPGGGFIGGLVFASALVLRVMVLPARAPRRDLIALSGLGLLCALTAAVLPLFFSKPFFTGLWAGEVWLPAIGKMKLGTPLLFDIGVFLVVTGVGAQMLLVLLAQHREARNESQNPGS